MNSSVERFEIPSEENSRVDLHVHSSCSDGRLTPAEVIAAVAECGLEVVALTDHDTVSGVEEALRAAEIFGVELIPGIELSTYDENGSTHLLGYFVDHGNPDLLTYTETARASRLQRAREIVGKLNGLGVDLDFDDVLAQAPPGGLIARPHVARALVAGGWVRGYAEAFSRFIAAGQPAYVPTRHTEPLEGIGRIHSWGGLAFLAHGGKSHSVTRIQELADAGLDGLEILHPDHREFEVRKLRELAAELDLLESGGSDWHGPRDDRRGQLGGQPVPYGWYTKLRQTAERKAASSSGRSGRDTD